jgi:hypothetical protein
LNSICKDKNLKLLIEDASAAYSELTVLSSNFLLFHVLRLLQDDIEVPAFDYINSVFVKISIEVCKNLGKEKTCPDSMMETSRQLFKSLLPEHYRFIDLKGKEYLGPLIMEL